MDTEPNYQSRITKGIFILLGLIVLLIILFAWQRERILNMPFFSDQSPAATVTTQTQDTDAQKTEKQQRIEKVAPNTDLAEFDIPDDLIDEEHIVALTIDRTGEIAGLLPEEDAFELTAEVIGQAKTYTVFVTPTTTISIDFHEEVYRTPDDDIPQSVNNENLDGTFADLTVGDIVYTVASAPVNGDSFTAELISFKKNKITILNP